MNQADRDAEQWMRENAKWQYRNWVNATETGTPYYIDNNGYVITETKKEEEKK